MEREAINLDFFKGKLSRDPLRLFEQLYVSGVNRLEAERNIRERLGEREDGIFILRDASQAPYPIPENRNLIFTISYWNRISLRFNHLFICSDETKLYWSILVDENEFQTYPSLRDILNDLPSIRNTGMKNALVNNRMRKRSGSKNEPSIVTKKVKIDK